MRVEADPGAKQLPHCEKQSRDPAWLPIPKESFEDIPLNLSGKLEAEPFDIQLPQAIALAMTSGPSLDRGARTRPCGRRRS